MILHMTLVDRAVKSIWQFRLLAVVGLVTATVSIGSADSIMISKDEIPDVRVYAQLDGSSIDVYFNNSMCRFTPTQIDTLRDRIGTYLRWHAKVSKETGARIEKPIGQCSFEYLSWARSWKWAYSRGPHILELRFDSRMTRIRMPPDSDHGDFRRA